ncbi:alpha/beta hydrolase [Pseudonocardia bannensis]|uniref:Alpha/beta hydrolase n=1 Tax=Pseudonocardia bannensis TaxID=630973 RepID=A0A848DGR4_9PSEU|nr:alpha/beta hydrolase fold domain-containing protein [Pseudonocardia bannensis]NMH91745.1 alpha/beta hydrolase [Pseudonocardia bannensis]
MTDTAHGVPAALLEFQTTMRLPAGGSPVELLKSFDDYSNSDPPPVAAVHRGVPLRADDGWRLGVDVTVPLGDGPFPALVYLHGGGWVMGSPWTHRRLAAELAARGLLVVSVDYRRAPKYRFPGAVGDAAFALDWARSGVAEFGGDPGRLLVGGDSAGANLAAALLAAGVPGAGHVRAALLFYGVYDYHRALPTLSGLLGGDDAASQLYLQPADFDALRGDPRLSPEGHVAGFPPTWLTVGERDPLRPESEALAARLAAASVEHELHVAPGAPHGYLQLPTHPAHDAGLSEMAAFLRRTGLLPADPEAA